MSFLVSAKQFKQVFSEEKNLSEQFMEGLMDYLKSHQYVNRLKEMYEWLKEDGEISMFTCRADLVNIMGEKMNLSKVPFVAVTDREGNYGFLVKKDSTNAVLDITKIVQEERGQICTITSLDGLKKIIGTSKHQDKGLITITGLTLAQMYLLEQKCMRDLNPEAIGEDMMEDGTYSFSIHGKTSFRKKKTLGLCLLETMLATNGKNAQINNKKITSHVKFQYQVADHFGMDRDGQPPVYVAGNDNQYMKISRQGFEYGHAVKESGTIKLVKEFSYNSQLPDYYEQQLSCTSRFSDATVTTDTTELMSILTAVLSAKFLSQDEKDVKAEETMLAGKICEMVEDKTKDDTTMQAEGQYAVKMTHIVTEISKVIAGAIENDIPPGYDKEDMDELKTIGNGALALSDYGSLPSVLRSMEISTVDEVFEKKNLKEALTNVPVLESVKEKEETTR